MTTQLPWLFEPVDPEGARDHTGKPWQHAVRGRKPQRPSVIGYGHHPDDAEQHAIREAHQQDAREVLGQRGEVVTSIELMTLPRDTDFINDRRYLLQKLCEMYGWPIMEPADSAIVNISV